MILQLEFGARRRASSLRLRAHLRVVVLALALSSLAPALASGAPLRGRVVDSTGDPVAWASIESRDSSGVWRPVGHAREDGTFRGDYGVGPQYSFRVRRLGYREWIGSFVPPDSTHEIVVRLSPLPRPIAGIEVTALRRSGRAEDLSVPVDKLRAPELRDRVSPLPTIGGQLRQRVEVSVIGRDDYNAAPAIRGLARFRTVLFLDGARVQSDREIGPTAGFVDPASLQSVEIVRGPGSVLYGSDAIGGVLLLKSDDAVDGAWAETGWSSVNQAVRSVAVAAMPLGSARLSVSASHAAADDYLLPASASNGAVTSRRAENSGFERNTGRARIAWGGVEATAFYSLGRNIGRPAREAERFTVPREEHVLTTLRWRFDEDRHATEARIYAHPVSWRATVEEPTDTGTREQERRYRSADWGAVLTYARSGPNGSSVAGAQVDARSGVRIHRRLVERDSVGAALTDRLDRWVEGASVGQGGLFAHGIRRAGTARWNAGGRVDFAWREGSARDVRRVIPTGGAGVSVDLAPDLSALLNLASAFREPTVTELFFAGKRPAGYIEGNPDLRPERSYQVDLGARWTRGEWFGTVSTYGILIEDYIGTRLRAGGAGGAADTLLYDNTSRATLLGGSIGFGITRPWRGFGVSGFVDAARASDGAGDPLPDVSPVRGTLELSWSRGNSSAGLAWRGAAPRRRVGMGETPAPGYGVVDVRLLVPLGPVQVRWSVENVLDQEYYERPEPVSYPSPGRAVGIAIRWTER